MFNTENAEAKLVNFNPRAERHGDDNKLAADIKFELDQSGAILEHWGSGLRASLFREVQSGEQQRLDGDAFTAVRHPRIGKVSWDEEFPGYELTIDGALGVSDPITLVDVTLRKFTFEPKEGGTVTIGFSVICHPDSDEAGLLCALIQSDVQLTLVPPVKQETGDAQADLLEINGANDDAGSDHLQQAADALEKAA